MASAVDICNLGLAHLGDEAAVSAISPPDGSVQASHCARFYPIARDACLEAHSWGFATRRVAPANVASAVPSSWQYAYALPAECLKVLNVWGEDYSEDDKGYDFVVESNASQGTMVYTNAENATIRYIVRVTDTTKFTPMFVTALSYLLAAYLSGPIVKGREGMSVAQAMYKMFLSEVVKAAASDSSNRKLDIKHTPDFIGVRGMNTMAPDAWIKR